MAYITVEKIIECTGGKLLVGKEDTVIKGFSVNSNSIKNGDMFVPTIGERTDGHKYIDMALEAGAVATFTSKKIDKYIEGKVYIEVKDTLKAFQAVARYMRENMPLPVVGVTGSVGKTTTIGKLASSLKAKGKKVVLGAADTFRAAAVDQLTIWAERAGVDIVKQEMGSDPASVAFDTLKSAVAKDADVVLVDTAGRLHNRIDLMNELTKIRNVMRKVVPDAPHEVLLVLDGSTGQNAFQQAKEFSRATDITAMAITKLDGTAKGGVVVGVVDQFQVPVKFVGIGEGIDDLKVFDKKEFVGSLFSKDDIV